MQNIMGLIGKLKGFSFLQNKKVNNETKHTEFSKKLVIVMMIWGMVVVSFSYFLVLFDKNANEAVTISIITTVIGTILGYLIYQAKLKINRNEHRLDEDGVPYDIIDKEEETTLND